VNGKVAKAANVNLTGEGSLFSAAIDERILVSFLVSRRRPGAGEACSVKEEEKEEEAGPITPHL